jgi:hypothetical protein
MKSNDATMTDDDVKALAELKRPLANIELRHPEEVFGMMVARCEPIVRTLSTDLAAARAETQACVRQVSEEARLRGAAEYQRDALQRQLDEAVGHLNKLVVFNSSEEWTRVLSADIRAARAFLSSIQTKEQSNG